MVARGEEGGGPVEGIIYQISKSWGQTVTTLIAVTLSNTQNCQITTRTPENNVTLDVSST